MNGFGIRIPVEDKEEYFVYLFGYKAVGSVKQESSRRRFISFAQGYCMSASEYFLRIIYDPQRQSKLGEDRGSRAGTVYFLTAVAWLYRIIT